MKYLKFILILTLIITPVFSFHTKKADAQFAAIVSGEPFTEGLWIKTSIATTLTAGIDSGMATWDTVRENWLNMLVYNAAQLMLNQITENIVNWIQTGFQGDPSFAVDPKRLFNDLADMVAGDLANQIRGLAVCDFDANFKLNLMNSLLLVQDQDSQLSRKLVCPFDIIDVSSCDSNGQNCRTISPAQRVEAFSQRFTNGLWGAYEQSLRDNGNKFGVALTTRQELDRRTAESQKTQGDKLTQSGGFLDVLDMSSCAYPPEVQARLDSGEVNSGEKQAIQRTWCKTGTPGSIVSSQLQKTTGLDMDRLGMADNLNKIATAFIQQLARTAIEGIYTPGTAIATPPGMASTIAAQEACAGAGGEVTEDQEAEIAGLVVASPRVQDANTALDSAETDLHNANTHLSNLVDEAETARIAFNDANTTARTALANYNTALSNYDACVASGVSCLFSRRESMERALDTAKRNLYTPTGSAVFTSVAALSGQPTSKEAIKNSKYVAYRDAVLKTQPGSPAYNAVQSATTARDNAISAYNTAADSAYTSAQTLVVGADVSIAERDCASTAASSGIIVE